MLVTPNWRVNPTPATARIEAVTRPNPIAGTRVLTTAATLLDECWPPQRSSPSPARSRSPCRLPSPADRRDLGRRHRADQREIALRVLRRLERAGGVVPVVEHDGAARADVLDLIAGLQRGLPGGEGAHDLLAGAWLGD